MLKRSAQYTIGIFLLLIAATTSAAHAKRSRSSYGKLEVIVTVENAMVLLNGKRLGRTPLEPIKVTAGTHTVTIRKPGFIAFSRSIRIRPGKTTSLKANLKGAEPLSVAGENETAVEESPPEDELNLLPIPIPAPSNSTVQATSPQPNLELSHQVAAAPWYHRWYYLTAAGAAVVGGITLGIVLSRQGSNSTAPGQDLIWRPAPN